MTTENFKPGRITWTSDHVHADELTGKYLNNPWVAGFAAFSNYEKQLREDEIKTLSQYLVGRSDEQGGPEGYLMEAGLWRNNATVFEELALEREGDLFFVQYWKLDTTDPEPDQTNCYLRPANTFPRGNIDIFKGSLATFEVIVPTERLRFYITRGQ